MAFIWIGKTDTPRLFWGYNGENADELHAKALKNVQTEKKGILLRGSYKVNARVKKAVVRVCGLGMFRFYVNGKECDIGTMAPLETDFRKRVIYEEIDVTDLLTVGENIFGIELGNGRYSTRKKYWGWRAKWYGDPMAFMEMQIDFDNGESDVFTTNSEWKSSYSAVTDNCIYDGEHYDARLEQNGWNKTGFDDSLWDNAVCVETSCDNFEKNEYFKIQCVRELQPELFAEPLFGYWVCKFSENIPGRARIRVKGKRGAKVIIRYAERFDIELDPRSNHFADNVDIYTLKGEGIEEYEPHFTHHCFSACIVSCPDRDAELVSVTACEVRACMNHVGKFWCDNDDVNRLHDVILRSQHAALMSYPFDCPQRDERLGWLGDAHITDLVCMYNMDMRKYYCKWFEDIHLGINSENGLVPHISPRVDFEHAVDWSAGYLIILWDYYLFYRDSDIINKYYDDAEKYYDTLTKDGKILPVSKYGDWMSVEEGWTRGDPRCCTTLYAYYVLKLLTLMSEATGRTDKQERYSRELREYKEYIIERFFNKDTCLFDDGSQFAQSFAIKLDLIPQDMKEKACEKLVNNIAEHDYHLTTGILGSKYIMEVLSQNGYRDIAMKLILQPDYPGWMDLIKGKTTISEKWDGSMSQNHCAFGSVDAVFYTMLGGINIGEDITVNPYFAKQINHVKCSLKTIKGMVAVEWKRADNKIELSIDCPMNVKTIINGKVTEEDNGRYIIEE